MSKPSLGSFCCLSALVAVVCYGTGLAVHSQAPVQAPVQTPSNMPTPSFLGQEAGWEDSNAITNGWLTVKDCFVKGETPVKIPAQETGLLSVLNVEENQPIAKGELVAKLDGTNAVAEYELRELQYQIALESAKETPEIAYLTHETDFLANELERYKSISKSVSDTELMAKKLAVERSRMALAKAQRGQSVAGLEAKREYASAKDAKLKLKRLEILAPRSGVITEILCSEGEWVTVGTTVATLEDLEHLRVDAFVHLDQIDRTRIKDCDVRVEFEAANGMVKLAGKIVSHDPNVDRGGLLRLRARVQNIQQGGHWALLKGTPVTMHIALPTSRERVSTRDSKLKSR